MEELYKNIRINGKIKNYNKIRRLNLLNLLIQCQHFYKEENHSFDFIAPVIDKNTESKFIAEASKKLVSKDKIFGLLVCNTKLNLSNKYCNDMLLLLINKYMDDFNKGTSRGRLIKVDDKLEEDNGGNHTIDMCFLNRPEIYKKPQSGNSINSKIHQMMNKVYGERGKQFLYLITFNNNNFSVVDYNDIKESTPEEPTTLENIYFATNFFNQSNVLVGSIIAKKDANNIFFYHVKKEEKDIEYQENIHEINSKHYNEFITIVQSGSESTQFYKIDNTPINSEHVVHYLYKNDYDVIEALLFMSDEERTKTNIFDALFKTQTYDNLLENIHNRTNFKELFSMQLVNITEHFDASKPLTGGSNDLKEIEETMKTHIENINQIHSEFHNIGFDDFSKMLTRNNLHNNFGLIYIYLKKEVVNKTLRESYVPSIDNISEVIEELEDYLRIYSDSQLSTVEEKLFSIEEGNKILDKYNFIFDIYEEMITMSQETNKFQFKDKSIDNIDLDSYYNNVNFNNIIDYDYVPFQESKEEPMEASNAVLLSNKKIQTGGRAESVTKYWDEIQHDKKTIESNIESIRELEQINKEVYSYGFSITSRIEKYIENHHDKLEDEKYDNLLTVLYSYYYLLLTSIHSSIIFDYGKIPIEDRPKNTIIKSETIRKVKMYDYALTEQNNLTILAQFVIQKLFKNNDDINRFFEIENSEPEDKKIKRFLVLLSTSGYNDFFICKNDLCKTKDDTLATTSKDDTLATTSKDKLKNNIFITNDIDDTNFNKCFDKCIVPDPETVFKKMTIEFNIEERVIIIIEKILKENNGGLNIGSLHKYVNNEPQLDFLLQRDIFEILKKVTYVNNKNLHNKSFGLFKDGNIVDEYPKYDEIQDDYIYMLLSDELKIKQFCPEGNHFTSFMDCLEEMDDDKFRENVNVIGKKYLELFDNSIAQDFNVNENPQDTDDFEVRKRFKYDIYGDGIDTTKVEHETKEEVSHLFDKLIHGLGTYSYQINLKIDEIIELEKNGTTKNDQIMATKLEELNKLKNEQVKAVDNDYEKYTEELVNGKIKNDNEEFIKTSSIKEGDVRKYFNPGDEDYFKYNVSDNEMDVIKDKIIERHKLIKEFTNYYYELSILYEFAQYLHKYPYNIFTDGLNEEKPEQFLAEPSSQFNFHTFEYYMDFEINATNLHHVFKTMNDNGFKNKMFDVGYILKQMRLPKELRDVSSDFGKKDMLYNVIKTKLRSLKILKLINNEADDREELFDLIDKVDNYVDEEMYGYNSKINMNDIGFNISSISTIVNSFLSIPTKYVNTTYKIVADILTKFTPGKQHFPYSENEFLIDSYSGENVYSFKEMYLNDQQYGGRKNGSFQQYEYIDNPIKGQQGVPDKIKAKIGDPIDVTYPTEQFLTIHKNNLNLQLYTDISRLKRFRKFDKAGCYNKLGILSYQYPLLQEKEEMDNFKLIDYKNDENIAKWGNKFITDYPYDKLHMTDVTKLSSIKEIMCKGISTVPLAVSNNFFKKFIINSSENTKKHIGFRVEEDEEEGDGELDRLKEILNECNGLLKKLIEKINYTEESLHLWNGLFKNSIFRVRQITNDFLCLMIFWFLKPVIGNIHDDKMETLIKLNTIFNSNRIKKEKKRKSEMRIISQPNSREIHLNIHTFINEIIKKLGSNDNLIDKLKDYNNNWLSDDVIRQIMKAKNKGDGNDFDKKFMDHCLKNFEQDSDDFKNIINSYDFEKTKSGKGGGNTYFNPLTRKSRRSNRVRNSTQKIKHNM